MKIKLKAGEVQAGDKIAGKEIIIADHAENIGKHGSSITILHFTDGQKLPLDKTADVIVERTTNYLENEDN